MRRILPCALVALFLGPGAGCTQSAPAGPGVITSNPQLATRIISVGGSMSFGTVDVGITKTSTLTIQNSGNSPMTVSRLQASSGIASVITATPSNFTVSVGGRQDVAIAFTPMAAVSYAGTIAVTADQTSGTHTVTFSGAGAFRNTRTQFNSGTFLINATIDPGRYFSAPRSGCYWARKSGLGGTPGEIIASDVIDYVAVQYIVDIAGSDRAFETDPACGTWIVNAPRRGLSSNISPGLWLVGSQVAPGLYRTTHAGGCYWERLRSFGGQLGEIVANNFIAAAGTSVVEVRPGDTGFHSDGDCGTWTPAAGAPTFSLHNAEPEPPTIEGNRSAFRAHQRGRR